MGGGIGRAGCELRKNISPSSSRSVPSLSHWHNHFIPTTLTLTLTLLYPQLTSLLFAFGALNFCRCDLTRSFVSSPSPSPMQARIWAGEVAERPALKTAETNERCRLGGQTKRFVFSGRGEVARGIWSL